MNETVLLHTLAFAYQAKSDGLTLATCSRTQNPERLSQKKGTV